MHAFGKTVPPGSLMVKPEFSTKLPETVRLPGPDDVPTLMVPPSSKEPPLRVRLPPRDPKLVTVMVALVMKKLPLAARVADPPPMAATVATVPWRLI
jgi:hypothetical protein